MFACHLGSRFNYHEEECDPPRGLDLGIPADQDVAQTFSKLCAPNDRTLASLKCQVDVDTFEAFWIVR